MKRGKFLLIGLLAIAMIAGLCSCVAVKGGGGESDVKPLPEAPASAEVAEPSAKLATSEIPAPQVYQEKVAPLTTLECAQCHYKVFAEIRDMGGKHQIQCRECHQTFHDLRPGVEWKDVIPHCTNCHGEIHGKNFLECMTCHTNAHAPINSLVNMEALSRDCGACHATQGAEIAQYPSKHATDVACSDCHHTRHGFIPACTECHPEPHTAFVDNAGCGVCHLVHKPLEIAYGADTANNVCSGCHADVNRRLSESSKKHSTVACVSCHENKHRYIPDCSACHQQPHSDSLLKRFAGCADCHGEPHALTLYLPGK